MYEMKDIDEFLEILKKQKNTSLVSNPYLSIGPLENLIAYLEVMLNIQGKRILLVGEAPGYKGCGITGIPFTSGNIFGKTNHPILKKIKPKLTLEQIESENTATIVWGYLKNKDNTPLFWNSYPYHPHPKGQKNKNRAPTNKEIESGVIFLKALSNLFKPELIAGIGKSGLNGATQAFPEIEIKYIRHPSFGGKQEFIKGMDKII